MKIKNSGRIRVLPADLYLTHTTTSCPVIKESFCVDAVEEGPKPGPSHCLLVEFLPSAARFCQFFCLSLRRGVKKVNLLAPVPRGGGLNSFMSGGSSFRRGIFLGQDISLS